MLHIKGMEIGAGVPRTVVPITDTSPEAALETVERGRRLGADCFELRADYAACLADIDATVAFARTVHDALPDNPLIFTCRTVAEGGRADVSMQEYCALNSAIAQGRCADVIDIELNRGNDAVLSLVEATHDAGLAALVSYHDFEKTPERTRMVRILQSMLDAGADIAKLAVMAIDTRDALELMSATRQVHSVRPDAVLLTMAMGAEGCATRLLGEMSGSALTFCSIGTPSAPGQIDLAQAASFMDSFHAIMASASDL